jgi:acyl-CoA synthetase (AMP-forming)/AMP-acid ligase II
LRQPYLVHHLLEESTLRAPDRPFVIHEGRVGSYGEIAARAHAWAALLAREGLRRGDRVGLLARNGRLYVEAYYGILRAGGIAVPLNTALDGRGVRALLSDCGARKLIAGPGFRPVVQAGVRALEDLDQVIGTDDACAAAQAAGVPCLGVEAVDHAAGLPAPAGPPVDLDVASIIYTSGSTGHPRGATLSHRNICTNTASIVRYLELTADDRVLAVLPFYYVYGKSLLNTHAAAGGSVVIENRFLFPNTALDTLEHERCTGLSGVPSTFAILLNRSNLAERRLEHLRYLTQAGGPMSPEHTRRLLELLPRQRLFIMYGATEASARLSYLDPSELSGRIGSIGKAIPNVELRVLKEDGSEAGPGEVGEIVARGSNIMSGYWNDPQETARVLGPEGYHTGDLARRDDEGFLYVVGRKKDMIKTGAHRVSAKEIEEAIVEHQDVHEAAVIGEPDEMLGEIVSAYVVFLSPDDGQREDLLGFLKKRLPAYKVPGRIHQLGELPKNESGKIMKQALRTAAEARVGTGPPSEEGS